MRYPYLLLFFAIITAQAQNEGKPKPWAAPHTPDGQPDLQGLWTNTSLTPFERPRDLADKEFFTPAEAAAYAKQMAVQQNRDRRGATAEEDVGGAYNDAWFDRGSAVGSNRRTSVVIDPKDGRVPALTPAAGNAVAARAAILRRPSESAGDFTNNVRCLLWGTAGPPMLPGPYNNNYQIIQTKDYVTIQIEMIHDTRIIPLDGRAHLPVDVQQWMGDSLGHWEGETLVVDTRNFRGDTNFRGSDGNLHLVERFTRTAPEVVTYQFTVDNPTAFTRPWTGEINMTSTPGPLYEYACHEGNEALPNILKGARAQERAAASAR